MGAHINAGGDFQSDKYPTCPPGKVPLSVKDPTAQDLLWEYAQRRRPVDAEFSDDLETVLRAQGFTPANSADSAAVPIANDAGWQPIETAPPDDRRIDLWVVSDRNPAGHRFPDCQRTFGNKEAWADSNGRWVNGMNYYDDEADECFVPGNDPKPEEKVVRVTNRSRATHWMPRPAAPR